MTYEIKKFDTKTIKNRKLSKNLQKFKINASKAKKCGILYKNYIRSRKKI